MSEEEKRLNDKLFWSIVQGKLKTEVPETHPDAEVRHWEAGGKKGTKIERSIDSLVGKIIEVSFYEGESDGRKFTSLNVVMDANKDGKKPVISTGITTRYAQDLLKKLPDVQFGKFVRIRPYSFTPEGEEKVVSGTEVVELDDNKVFKRKVGSFFHFQDGAGKWKTKPGYPLPEGDTTRYTSDDWQIYFKQVNRFLVNYTKEHVIPALEARSWDKAEANREDDGAAAVRDDAMDKALEEVYRQPSEDELNNVPF